MVIRLWCPAASNEYDKCSCLHISQLLRCSRRRPSAAVQYLIFNLISCIAWLMRWGAAKYAISKESAQMCLTKNKSFRWQQCEGERRGAGREREREARLVYAAAPLPPIAASVARQRPGNNARHSGDIVAKAFYNSHESPHGCHCLLISLFLPLSTASFLPFLLLSLLPALPRLLLSTYSHCHLFAPQQL